MPLALTLVFATVFLHEIILQFYSIGVYGISVVTNQIFSYYILILAVTLFFGYYFGNFGQRKRLRIIFALCVLFDSSIMIFYSFTRFAPYTLIEFKPGPQAMNLEANVVEISGWLIAILPWYIIKR